MTHRSGRAGHIGHVDAHVVVWWFLNMLAVQYGTMWVRGGFDPGHQRYPVTLYSPIREQQFLQSLNPVVELLLWHMIRHTPNLNDGGLDILHVVVL